jgi:hypothetical protein
MDHGKMDQHVVKGFKDIESIVLDSILSQKGTIIDYAKQAQAVEKPPAFSGRSRKDDKEWRNWAGNIVFKPEKILYPKSVEDLKNYVKQAKKEGKKIRCVSDGHSWSSLSVTNDYLVIVDHLKKINVEKRNDGWVVNAEAGELGNVVN